MGRTCIVALSDLTTDPRPRRHVALLTKHGVDVTAVGYPPRGEPATPYVVVDPPSWPRSATLRHALGLAVTRLRPRLADDVYWRSPGAQALLEAVRTVDADLYVSHDLYALPVVARVAAERGARYAYEAREFYVGQHADRRRWRMLWPAYADELQRSYIRDAVWVSTVSNGLADWLQQRYRLTVRPTVVRSIPDRAAAPESHSLGSTWTVLFHGWLRPDRNVHGVIESVPLWAPHLKLIVRGDGQPAYLQTLRDLVSSLGIEDRVDLQPGVPIDQVVERAAEFEIGVIPWPLDLPQKRFALPNKLFEYLAAGLCVVQTGPSESATLVEDLGAGTSYAPATPDALAGALNALTPADLDRFRSGARSSADSLSWEHEAPLLWALHEPG